MLACPSFAIPSERTGNNFALLIGACGQTRFIEDSYFERFVHRLLANQLIYAVNGYEHHRKSVHEAYVCTSTKPCV